MSKWYQLPKCLPPLDADPGSGGKPSDHLIVVMEPVTMINNKPARIVREVIVRPMKQSGIDLFGMWLKKQSWEEVFEAKTVDEKSEVLQNMLLEKLEEFLPQKVVKISSDDQPFCSEKMKRLKRIKSREFRKHRKSKKWKDLDVKYNKEVKKSKKKYYHDIIKDLKKSKPGQWHSKLKRLCSYDQKKAEPVVVESIKHLSDKDQAEAIADKFAKISQEYEPLNSDAINIPEFDEKSVPRFTPAQVQKHLQRVKTKKAVPPGDIPPLLIKKIAAYLSKPLCDVINSSIMLGKWSKLYKSEMVTPVPKVFPPKSVEELRNISDLLPPSQFANQNGILL